MLMIEAYIRCKYHEVKCRLFQKRIYKKGFSDYLKRSKEKEVDERKAEDVLSIITSAEECLKQIKATKI